MAYADDITITSTHTSTSAAKKYIQPYVHKDFSRTKQNNLILNPDETIFTLFTPDSAEYTSNMDLKIHINALPMATHPKVLSLTLDPKLTSTTSQYTHTHKPLQQTYKQTCAIYIHLLSLCIYPQEAIRKYYAHLHHTLAAPKRYFPASFDAPLPNSEQTNLPSSNHTYAKSTLNHIHHHYAPSVTPTHHLFN